jgi:hypothetical protein
VEVVAVVEKMLVPIYCAIFLEQLEAVTESYEPKYDTKYIDDISR